MSDLIAVEEAKKFVHEDITTRIATAQDAEAIREIYRPYVEETAISFEYQLPTVEEFRRRIGQTLIRYPYIVALQNDVVVGYAYAGSFMARPAYDWSVELSIYVEQNHRRMGIGQKLMSEMERLLQKQNIVNLCACISTTEDKNDPYLDKGSVRFHRAMGFQPAAHFEKSGYKFDRWYDIVWMTKSLQDHASPMKPVVPFSAPVNMSGRYHVVTLCGSTRFKDAYLEAQKRLTLAGNIVISVGLFGHSGDMEVWEGKTEGIDTLTKAMLDDMHKNKIDLADEIYVINVGGYIGESTASEIEYAKDHGKIVRYLENPLDSETRIPRDQIPENPLVRSGK